MYEQGRIDLVNYNTHLWLTHTAAAGRQYVDIIQGRTNIPAELRPAALESHLEFPDDMSVDFGPIDAVVVEVSSYKQHRINGIELNAHKVYGIAKQAGVDHRPIIEGRTEALPDDHVLKSLEVSFATQDELAADLLTIRDRLGAPTMTVDHLYTEMPDGSPVPVRERLTTMLSRVQQDHGIPLHTTKETILEHGFVAALEDQNHYRYAFEPVVGNRLLTGIGQMVGASV